MKLIAALLVLALGAGCAVAPKSPPKKKRSVVKERGSAVTPKQRARVRTDEVTKAYPVGRYVDPDLPDVMHERHTIYRREQAPDWNLHPDAPHALPLGPVVATSTPTASYYAKTEAEQMTAQQRAQAAALAEQNRALQKRLAALQESQSTDRAEIDRLKRELATLPSPTPAPPTEVTASSAPEPWASFSNPTP